MSTSTEDVDVLDDRDSRALTSVMSVLDDLGRARGDDDRYLVVTTSEYLVDLRAKTCECPDSRYRSLRCYHLRRVEFETGEREIPTYVDVEAIDEQFGAYIEDSVDLEK